MIVFCFNFDCMFVQTWICSKPFLSKFLIEVQRFRCLSVLESWDALFPAIVEI